MNKTAATVFAALAVSLICGCGREEIADPVERRMKDPAYLKQLKAQDKERKEIMTELSEFRKEYEAARAEDPEGKGEKMKALELRRQEISKKIEVNRLKTAAIVRERMHKDIKDRQSKQKGN
jgi:hypothetical protein